MTSKRSVKTMTSRETSEAFELAIQHRQRGEHKEAIELLNSLMERTPSYYAVLGDSYWELGLYPEAIRSFKKAIELAPESEASSLGLFHCLWETGDVDGAFDEMRRFLSLADSAEYRRLLSDINRSPED